MRQCILRLINATRVNVLVADFLGFLAKNLVITIFRSAWQSSWGCDFTPQRASNPGENRQAQFHLMKVAAKCVTGGNF